MRRMMVRLCTCLGMMMLAAGMAAGAEFGLDKGESEGTGFAGVSDGHLTLGGAFGKAITDKIFVQGEVNYISGASASGVVVGTNFDYSSHALGINGTVQYNFTNAFKNSPKLVPYAGGGLGIYRVSVSASAAGFSQSASDSDVLLHFGGGLRYYVKPNWGFKPEVMVFTGSGSFVRASAGIFFQF